MMHDKEARLIMVGEEGYRHRVPEVQHVSLTDVRSTESQFQQMERAHDRIRAEELGARLGEQTND
jgi:hypothetical protein